MARRNSLDSHDVSELRESLDALEKVVGQMECALTSFEEYITNKVDTLSALQTEMSDGRQFLQNDISQLTDIKLSIDTYVSEIQDQKIGYNKRDQSQFLQNNLPTFKSIDETLVSIKSKLRDQEEHYKNQIANINDLQDNPVRVQSEISELIKSIEKLINSAEESLLVATVVNIGWEISITRKEIYRRISWLWGFMITVIVIAVGWVILEPMLSIRIPEELSNLSGWQNILLNRVSIPAILTAPFLLIKKSLDSTSEEAKLYQHKEVMLKTLLVFRNKLGDEDESTKDEILKKMIEAISIKPWQDDQAKE